MDPRPVLLSLPFAASLTGCAVKANAGYVTPLGPGRDAAVASVHLDYLASHHTHTKQGFGPFKRKERHDGYRAVYGFGGGARVMAGPDRFQFALAAEGLVGRNPEDNEHNPGGDRWTPTLRGGVHALQLGSTEGRFDVGVGSPWLQASLAYCSKPYINGCWSLGAVAQYDVRFGGPGAAYAGLVIGAGY